MAEEELFQWNDWFCGQRERETEKNLNLMKWLNICLAAASSMFPFNCIHCMRWRLRGKTSYASCCKTFYAHNENSLRWHLNIFAVHIYGCHRVPDRLYLAQNTTGKSVRILSKTSHGPVKWAKHKPKHKLKHKQRTGKDTKAPREVLRTLKITRPNSNVDRKRARQRLVVWKTQRAFAQLRLVYVCIRAKQKEQVKSIELLINRTHLFLNCSPITASRRVFYMYNILNLCQSHLKSCVCARVQVIAKNIVHHPRTSRIHQQ